MEQRTGGFGGMSPRRKDSGSSPGPTVGIVGSAPPAITTAMNEAALDATRPRYTDFKDTVVAMIGDVVRLQLQGEIASS